MNKQITILLLLLLIFNYILSQNVKVLPFNDTTADLKVKIVQDAMLADIWVVVVFSRQDAKYEKCYWHFVRHREDFTVRFVEQDEDLKLFFSDSTCIIISEFVHDLMKHKHKKSK